MYIFVDEFFPKDVRSSAQGLFNVLILGVGPFAANFICGRLKAAYTDRTAKLDYIGVFQYSMGAGPDRGLILAVFYRSGSVEPGRAGLRRAEPSKRPESARRRAAAQLAFL